MQVLPFLNPIRAESDSFSSAQLYGNSSHTRLPPTGQDVLARADHAIVEHLKYKISGANTFKHVILFG